MATSTLPHFCCLLLLLLPLLPTVFSDICARLIDAAVPRGGLCGPNGYCSSAGVSRGSGPCFCPDEFSPFDETNYFLGCKPDFLLPSCQTGWEKQKENIEFKLVGQNVNWPFQDYDCVTVANEKECRQLCLDDCLCFVIIYEGGDNKCWKKQYPLSNGIYSESNARKVFIKKPKNIDSNGMCSESNTSNVIIKEPQNIDSDKKHQSTVVVLALLLVSSAFLNILFFRARSGIRILPMM